MEAAKRIKYIDGLKFLAIIGVISLHIFQIWWHKPALNLNLFYGMQEISQFGVPLFLMVTGALLLNRDIEIESFFKKKFSRIVYPFVFYLIIHMLVIPGQFNILGYNWYFWMILCAYLMIPIINKFVLYSSWKEMEYFVLVIVISSLILQLLNFHRVENFIDLSFFLGPLSYLILGYYFSKKKFKSSTNKIICICILLFSVSTVLKIMGHLLIIPVTLTQNLDAVRSVIFTSNIDVGILEFIQASSLFVLVKNIYDSKSGICARFRNVLEKDFINSFIQSVSRASYGMYLVNRTLMLYSDYNIKNLPLTGKEKIMYIIILNIAIFFISWILVVGISKIPFLKKFSGYA